MYWIDKQTNVSLEQQKDKQKLHGVENKGQGPRIKKERKFKRRLQHIVLSFVTMKNVLYNISGKNISVQIFWLDECDMKILIKLYKKKGNDNVKHLVNFFEVK